MSGAKGNPLQYTLSRVGTRQGVGWFSCVPAGEITLGDIAAHLEKHPHDQFLRQHALDRMGNLEPNELVDLVEKAGKQKSLLRVLAYEASLTAS